MYQKPEPSRVPGPALKAGYVVSRRALDRYLFKGVRDRSDAIDRVRLRGQSFCPLDKLQPDKTWQGGRTRTRPGCPVTRQIPGSQVALNVTLLVHTRRARVRCAFRWSEGGRSESGRDVEYMRVRAGGLQGVGTCPHVPAPVESPSPHLLPTRRLFSRDPSE